MRAKYDVPWGDDHPEEAVLGVVGIVDECNVHVDL